jgi:DNA-binding ferritin-like protein
MGPHTRVMDQAIRGGGVASQVAEAQARGGSHKHSVNLGTLSPQPHRSYSVHFIRTVPREARATDKEVPERGIAYSSTWSWRVRRRSARIGARMSRPRRDDPTAALNQVLSEAIDAILDVRQAHRRVPETHALHAVLDQLFADLRTWARLLAEQDQSLGVSPLASMPTAAGRTPPNPWHGAASDEEVRRIVGEHLDRLGQLLAAALAEQRDEKVRAALTEVQRGILSNSRALSEL